MHCRNLQEPKKVAVKQRRRYILGNLLIHLIPVTVVAVIVTLNIKGQLFVFFIVDRVNASSNWIPALFYAAQTTRPVDDCVFDKPGLFGHVFRDELSQRPSLWRYIFGLSG